MNKKSKVLAILFTTGLVLAGCGQKDNSTTTTSSTAKETTTTTATTTAPTTTTVATTTAATDGEKKTVLEQSDKGVTSRVIMYSKGDVLVKQTSENVYNVKEMETQATAEQIKTQLETAFAAYKGVEGISSSVEVKDGKVIQNFTVDYSKTDFAKLKDRIIMVSGPVHDDMANAIIAQLLFLDAQDPEKDIYMYINSPGGSVTAGLAIYDTMNFIKADVQTIAMGLAASMGSFLLTAGAKGKRFALPNAEILIHQPLGGAQGQATEIEIAARQILKTRERLNKILAKQTGQKLSRIEKDTDRDNYMTAQEALEYGLIDAIMENR